MAKTKSNYKSICCNADVRIEGMDDFDKQCTMYHVCTYCNKPCDVTVKIRKTWKINPTTKVKGDERGKFKEKLTKKEIEDFRKNEDF
jgi:hypothetical protein